MCEYIYLEKDKDSTVRKNLLVRHSKNDLITDFDFNIIFSNRELVQKIGHIKGFILKTGRLKKESDWLGFKGFDDFDEYSSDLSDLYLLIRNSSQLQYLFSNNAYFISEVSLVEGFRRRGLGGQALNLVNSSIHNYFNKSVGLTVLMAAPLEYENKTEVELKTLKEDLINFYTKLDFNLIDDNNGYPFLLRNENPSL